MPEAEAPAEIIKHLKPKYLSEDFVDQAPIDGNLRKLTRWINVQVKKDVVDGVEKEWDRPLMPKPQSEAVQRHIKDLKIEHMRVTRELLFSYADHLSQKQINTLRGRNEIAGQHESWAKGVRFALGAIGLGGDAQALERVFENSSSIPRSPTVGKIVAGTARET